MVHYEHMITFVYMLIFVLGGVLASFTMCCSDRFNVKTIGGRSVCDTCGMPLSWYSLIPFVGAILGCRSCDSKGSWIYVLGELGFATVFLLNVEAIVGHLGYSSQAFFGVFISTAILSTYTLLAVIDAKHYVFPNSILVFLYSLIGIFSIGVFLTINPQVEPVMVFLKYVLLNGVVWGAPFLLISVFSKERLMGYGDGILVASMGLLIFPVLSFFEFCKNCVPTYFYQQSAWYFMMTMLMASLLGLGWALVTNYIHHKKIFFKKHQAVPFGPSLIIAFIVVVMVMIHTY